MIVFGAFFLVGGAFFTRALVKLSYYRWQWTANFVLICFFLCSYIFAVIHATLFNPFFINYFYASVFLLGSLYVLWVSYLSSKTMEKIKNIDELRLNYEKIRYQAEHDRLTGCYNRHFLMEVLDNRYQKIKLNGGHLVIMFIDLDNFKKINDECGHEYGDQILQHFGYLLRQQFRKEDIVARYGGDEFVVLIENISLKKGLSLARKIIGTTTLITEQNLNQTNIKLGCSIGISQLTHDSSSVSAVLNKADQACYKAKKIRSNAVCLV